MKYGFLDFGKNAMQLEYMFIVFVTWKTMWYWCNMNFLWHNNRWWFFLLSSFFQSDFALMLHRKVLFTTLRNITLLELFFDGQKRWWLGKKFFGTNFSCFTPFAVNDFWRIQVETTNWSTKKTLPKQKRTFTIEFN